MFMRLFAALFASLPVAVAAQDTTSFIGAHGAMTPGSYIGNVEGDPRQLDLWPDQSFHFVSDGVSHAGRWYADPTRKGLVLDLGDETVFLELRNSQRLRPVDASEDGSQDLELSETFSPGSLEITLSGMLTYFADAATIVHCATGRTYPVAQDADYLALERMYLKDRTGPAAPLFVTMKATIEQREQMEGPDRLTVVPEIFGSAFRGEDCSLGNRSLDLHDAVWTIRTLGEVELDAAKTAREPSMVFDARAGTFLASVGCNTMRGTFSVSESELSFAKPIASTMMACPDPFADWEARLGEALSDVVQFEIGGRSLRFLDADGDRLAELRAVYLP